MTSSSSANAASLRATSEDNELSMLALHLLQNCMVYINTLMLQQILARPLARAIDRH